MPSVDSYGPEHVREIWGGESPLELGLAHVAFLRSWWRVFQEQLSLPRHMTHDLRMAGSTHDMFVDAKHDLAARWAQSAITPGTLTGLYAMYYMPDKPDYLEDFYDSTLWQDLGTRIGYFSNRVHGLAANLATSISRCRNQFAALVDLDRKFHETNESRGRATRERHARALFRDLGVPDDRGNILAMSAAVEEWLANRAFLLPSSQAPDRPFFVLERADLYMHSPVSYMAGSWSPSYASPVKTEKDGRGEVVRVSWNPFQALVNRIDTAIYIQARNEWAKQQSMLGSQARARFGCDHCLDEKRIAHVREWNEDDERGESSLWSGVAVEADQAKSAMTFADTIAGGTTYSDYFRKAEEDSLTASLEGFGDANLYWVAVVTIYFRCVVETGPTRSHPPMEIEDITPAHDYISEVHSPKRQWRQVASRLKGIKPDDERITEFARKMGKKRVEEIVRANIEGCQVVLCRDEQEARLPWRRTPGRRLGIERSVAFLERCQESDGALDEHTGRSRLARGLGETSRSERACVLDAQRHEREVFAPAEHDASVVRAHLEPVRHAAGDGDDERVCHLVMVDDDVWRHHTLTMPAFEAP